MIIDIQNKHDEIEQEIIDNQKSIFSLYNYYTKKWKGDRLNDINVGLFLNDSQQPTVQIFVRNKTGYIKSHVIFNKVGDSIIDTNIINYKLND
jgi:hypothetical protein